MSIWSVRGAIMAQAMSPVPFDGAVVVAIIKHRSIVAGEDDKGALQQVVAL